MRLTLDFEDPICIDVFDGETVTVKQTDDGVTFRVEQCD